MNCFVSGFHPTCVIHLWNVVAFYVTQVYSWFSHSIDAGDLRSFWLLNRAAVSILKHALVLTHPFTVEIISEAQRVGHMLGFSRFYFQLSSMAHSRM